MLAQSKRLLMRPVTVGTLPSKEANTPYMGQAHRYKGWLVVQVFSQRLDIDYEKVYSPVTCSIIFQFLISLTMSLISPEST